ncbi:MAG: MotA/TolQ/ExbB proton channel family protein [Gammaproteobacteria bacterium]|nr:MotA/TolQ/ExbB proton channel family protein [Gammaproteobacteria bacterium]
MLELFKAGGIVMWPLLACSIVALGIIVERFWSLQTKRVAPKGLLVQIWQWDHAGQLDPRRIQQIRRGSPLGRILAAGLENRRHSRAVVKESVEEIGHQVVHELEEFLGALSTIASVSPLLGLLGTVLGMIQMFNAITLKGVGDGSIVAGGIATALISTVTGLIVAIPTLIFYRYFRARVDDLVITMEVEALKMVEVMHGERDRENPGERAA